MLVVGGVPNPKCPVWEGKEDVILGSLGAWGKKGMGRGCPRWEGRAQE